MRLASLACALMLASYTERATADEVIVVDRVVAVVDDPTAPRGGATTLFLSDVRARAKPIVARMVPKPDRAQLEMLYRELTRALVNEVIVAREASVLGLAVSEAEIDRGIDAIAAHEQTTRAALLGAVVNQLGMTQLDYREEVRRRILDEKWTQERVVPRVARPAGARDDDSRFTQAIGVERLRVLDKLKERYFVMVLL
ncbi:MAG: SurA N-terminal domain-containing protein [Polyangiaceae bacterium]